MPRETPPRVVIVIGVAGSGKSTLGRALAETLGWAFHDADDLHSPDAIARMRAGLPLGDGERLPWLQRVRNRIDATVEHGASAVVACSALKARYRAILSKGIDGVRFVFLDTPVAVLRERLDTRPNHFAGVSLLQSQLEALEPPGEALVLDGARPVAELVRRIRDDLRL